MQVNPELDEIKSAQGHRFFLMKKIGMLTCITIAKTPDTWPKASQMLIQV